MCVSSPSPADDEEPTVFQSHVLIRHGAGQEAPWERASQERLALDSDCKNRDVFPQEEGEKTLGMKANKNTGTDPQRLALSCPEDDEDLFPNIEK